jgi:hypothetical protein
VEPLVERWILPCGIAGATVVATWLVEAKQSVIENMAPVLARIFVPLFALVLLAFVVTMAVTGRGIDVEREILIAIDMLLVVVFGLLLYSISARDPMAPPGTARLDPARAGRGGPAGGCTGAMGHRRADLGDGLDAEPAGGAGDEPGPAGEPRRVPPSSTSASSGAAGPSSAFGTGR